MEFQLLGESVRHLTPAVTQLPSLLQGTMRPKGQDLWQKDVLPAGTALAIWLALSGVGWAIIIGLLYWIA